MPPRILAFAGSLRSESFNQAVVAVAAAGARAAGAEVTEIRLRDYPLPVYDADIESANGLPKNALALKAMMHEHEGLLIAAPEYNSSITAALKNFIDWTSRAAEGETPVACFRGKTAGLVAASPGGLGGLRGLVHVRSILGNLGVVVLPEQHAVSQVHEKLGEGQLTNERDDLAVRAIGARLAEVTGRLS